jgi:colanic acid biosynthesis glycosyl transferase WcaI
MGKKFLLISQVFYPDQVSTANLFSTLGSALSEEGIEVEVWSAHPSYTVSERQPRKIIYKGMTIYYLPSTNFKKSSFPGRVLNILTFLFSASLKLLFSKEKVPVWVHTTPPILPLALSGLCSLRNRKFINILLDIFPEGLIRLGKVSRRNIFIRLWQRMFKNSLLRSEKIIVIGRDIAHYVLDIYPECQEKLEYIPHWQDDNIIFPVNFSDNNFVIEKQLGAKFVVQFSGNFGIWNDVKTMGKAVMKNIDNVFYIFVGEGIRKAELLNEIRLDVQENVMVLPFQDVNNFNNILNASHVHLVTLNEGLEGMAVPCKIYGILASGRPVIGIVPANSEIAYIIKEENCGLVVAPGDLDGFIEAIIFLRDNEATRILMGQNGRKAFEQKYTSRAAGNKYIELINRIM